MAKAHRRPNHKPFPKLITISGLLILALVTVLIVSIAVNKRSDIDSAGTVPSSTGSVTPPIPEPSVEPSPEPESEPIPLTETLPSQRILASGTEPGHLVRATVGECQGASGTLEVSFDGGTSWSIGATQPISATKMLQIGMGDSSITRLTSLDANCEVQAARSFVGGTSWQLSETFDGPWYVDQTDANVVHINNQVSDLPCTAASLVSLENRGAVLCSDSTVSFTENTGDSWSQPQLISHAVALGLTPTGYIVASFQEPGCTGVSTHIFDTELLPQSGNCVSTETSQAETIAVSGASDYLYLWAGDTLSRSPDQGVTWEAVS